MAVSSLYNWIGLTLLASLFSCQAQQVIQIEFTTEEEKGADHYIGNTAERSGLTQEFSGNLQLLDFSALSTGNADVQYLRIDPSNGAIHTAKNIDRETICTSSPDCSIKVTISVNRRSPGSDSLQLLRLLQVTIKILDINDEAPTFEKRVVNLQIPENLQEGYELFTSVATDRDSEGPNSIITYKLVPSTPDFMVTTQTTSDGFEDLVITVKRVLDREVQAAYALEVVASDNGNPVQSSSVLINVQVTDVNDNAPQFGRDNYTVNVLENSDTDVPVVVVSASDRDAGDNARVSYSLSSQATQKIKATFTVNGDTGEVFSRQKLDFEQEEVYQFYVTATDRGSAPESASALVTVQVMDVNDNRPKIEVTAARFGDEVTEHGSVGKFLAHIKVSDEDRGVNGEVSCSIADQHFSLEPFDASSPGFYKIVLSRELDREEAAQREVEIRCEDGGIPALWATASLPISVVDINDNPPVFVSESLQGSVLEERGPNALVMQVEAVDPDAGENARVTYTFGNSESNALFSIDQVNGVVSTRGARLDREARKVYYLLVVATDNGPVGQRMSSTATATVRILDENDNPPRFTQQGFSTSITENLPEGSPAGQVSATDDDIDQNARFQFSILEASSGARQAGEDDGKFFTINPQTGLLLSVQPFDREKKDSYRFSVKVTDPAASNYYDIANVTVTIDDDNDHAPVVVKPPRTQREFACPFNRSAGDVIVLFQAEDLDDPKLTEITYTVRIGSGSAPASGRVDQKSAGSGLFSMDPLSGNLRVAREIRPEDIGVHRLEVVVRDGPGVGAQSTVVPVSITVAEGSAEEMRRFEASSDLDNNVTIVSVIVVCTVILAIVIIVVICFIRRVDRNRKRRGLAASTHPAPSSPSHQAQMDAKMYQAAQWVNTVTPNDPHQNGVKARLEVPGSEKVKKKKEVSFSLDDMVVESPDTSGSVNSVFASRHKQDGLSYKQTSEQSFIVMDGMTTPDFSQHLYDRRSSSTDNPDERQFMEVGGGGVAGGHAPGRAAEDRYSDASSGDTGTSDSGRGGSEDESHGHGSTSGDRGLRKSQSMGAASSKRPVPQHHLDPSGLEEEIPGSPTPMLQQQHDDSSDSTYHSLQQPKHCYIRRSFDRLPGRGASALSSPSPSLKTFESGTHPRTPGKTSSFSSSSNNSNFNTIGGSGSNTGSGNNIHSHHPGARLTLSNNDVDGPYRMKRAQLLKTFSSPYSAQTATPGPDATHPAWRRARGLDTTWRPSTSLADDDNDDNTTTSGSYIISHDDLHGEENGTYNPDIMV